MSLRIAPQRITDRWLAPRLTRRLLYCGGVCLVLACSTERSQLLPELTEVAGATAVTQANRFDWGAITIGPDCASYRDPLSSLYLQHEIARRHVLGAWLLCALNKNDMRAARFVADRLLEETAMLDEWRATALWAYWLDQPSPRFPAYLPSVGGEFLAQAAVAAVANDQALAAELFAAFPAWRAWRPNDIERIAADLPNAVRVGVAKKLRARGRLPEAWLVLSPLWQQQTTAIGASLKTWWPSASNDDMIWFAELAFDLRRYADAAAVAEATFKSDRRQGSALVVWGRSLARSGRAGEAEQVWLAERQHVSGTPAWARVTYRLGLLAEDRGELRKAGEYYVAAANAVRHADSEEAGFRAGWLAKLAGDNQRAAEIWRQELSRRPEVVSERRLLYWLAQVSGPDAEHWRQKLQERAPLSFHNWLIHGQQWQALTAPVLWQETPLVASAPALRNVQFLHQLGFLPPARLELLQLLADLRDNEERLSALLTAQQLDLADEALRQFWRYFEGEFQPDAGPQRRDFWRVIYPRPYLPLVAEQAALRHLPPALLYAVMREESHFAASVLSPAGAVGLLQLMPATAQMVSRQQQLPYHGPASLERPEINVPIAAAYLQSLLKRYNGDLIYAVAAYNAGEGAVDRWLAKGKLPHDAFVEEIPYSETRRYVVKVLRSFVRYQAVYGDRWSDAEVDR